MAILSLVCLAGAGLTAFLPDPWLKADQKAEQDATKFGNLIAAPDRISWRMTEDVSLLRAMIWDGEGTRRYPPPGGMAPLPYEFSDELVRELTSIQAQIETAEWVPFDTSDRELLHCRAAPAVCLVYDRASLEEVLGLRPGALLSTGLQGGLAALLAALACLFGAATAWLWHRSPERAPAFRIVPERHLAIRDRLEVSLTPRDLKLLSILEDRNGAVVTKDELYDAGWGRDYMPNSRALDQHIINLRRKLDPDKSRPVLIETVHGVGYRLVP